MHPLRSRSLTRYIDSRQAGVFVGSHGIQLTGMAIWKIDKGQSMKEGFLEEWENSPQSWNPQDLEDFRGIVFSSCTMNARRVRLVELLATDSLLRLIDRVTWRHNERKSAFVAALESGDPLALSQLWRTQPEWHEDLGNAVLICIRALAKTGYDEIRERFNVLWIPNYENIMRLALDPAMENWVQMEKIPRIV